MIFTSIYGIVDGFFVSNFVNKTAFAAVNFIMPLLMILGAFGFMIGTGGTAIVAKTFGMGDKKLGNRYFSLLVYVTIIAGTALATLGIIFAEDVAALLGAEGQLKADCALYARINLLGLPFFMLQNVFQSFFITAEKPRLGLFVILLAGVTNMVLDALFVAVLSLGLAGAAAATALSQLVGGAVPLFYFAAKNSSTLRLGRTRFYGKMLLHTCTNGSSELMSNIASSIVTVLYNMQLIKYAKENGVAAYGVIMYVSFIFIAIFIGYSIGTAPIIGYHYGAANKNELKNLLKKSTVISFAVGTAMLIISFTCAKPLAMIFAAGNEELLSLTVHGLKIFSFSFIFSGFCIFASSMFTALNNGPVSAALSFMRTLVYQLVLILVLPAFFGLNGVWFSMLIAEALALITTVFFVLIKRNKYG